LQREALEMRRRRLGETHADVGRSLYGLGDVFYRSGRFAEAEKHFRMNLDLLTHLTGIAPSALAFPEVALGRLLMERGRLDEAEPLLRHALDGLRHDLPADHERIAFAEVLVGDCVARRGRVAEAAPLMQNGLRKLRAKRSGSEEIRYAESRLAALRLE
jgi:tetratricopeptide (TPR) repeat protein